jgi:hypothetical protein
MNKQCGFLMLIEMLIVAKEEFDPTPSGLNRPLVGDTYSDALILIHIQ